MESTILPITAMAAILIFIAKEILDFIKSRKRSKKTKEIIKLLLAYEIELNFWTLKNLFNLLAELNKYKSLDDLNLSIKRGIETNYSATIVHINNDSFYGQAIVPFHTERFERMLFHIGELGEKSYDKIQTAYSSLNELNDYRLQTINLFAKDEWIDLPNHTFDVLKGISNDYDKYYQDLNSAYMCLTGKQLKQHRLD